jgi:hypothetical protein
MSGLRDLSQLVREERDEGGAGIRVRTWRKRDIYWERG